MPRPHPPRPHPTGAGPTPEAVADAIDLAFELWSRSDEGRRAFRELPGSNAARVAFARGVVAGVRSVAGPRKRQGYELELTTITPAGHTTVVVDAEDPERLKDLSDRLGAAIQEWAKE